MFYCFTECGSLDIWALIIKVAKIQWAKEFNLNDAVRWTANHFGLSGSVIEDDELKTLADWKVLEEYERVQEVHPQVKQVILKEYDSSILNNFNYDVTLGPWIDDGISPTSMKNAKIGYYPGGDQITIPHFDINGRFIGLRGRAMSQEECELYGKYRPLKINGILYSHPLGMNLYGLNWNKENIKKLKKAVVVEGEKSVLLYSSYFGQENNIAVACCGSNISAYQVEELLNLGVEEMIIALDRQFQQIGDGEFQKLKANLLKLRQRYKKYINISFIFDKNMITRYKDSPLDRGAEIFMKLFKERIII